MKTTIREMMQAEGIDSGPNEIDMDIRKLFNKLAETRRQHTISVNNTHSKHWFAYCYGDKPWVPCTCENCLNLK